MDTINLLLRGLRIDWEEISGGSYLRGIPAISGLSELSFQNNVTFFVGENGSGKSTLLEAIAVCYGFNPEGGTKNYRFSTYDSHSELCDAMTLVKGVGKPGWGYFLRAESFYNVATAEDQYSRQIGGRPQFFHEKSHGESFLALAQSQFRGRGLYLLDETEAERKRKEKEIEKQAERERRKEEKRQREREFKNSLETEFLQQDHPVYDPDGNRWYQCKFCGKKGSDSLFFTYGGQEGLNRGVCYDCRGRFAQEVEAKRNALSKKHEIKTVQDDKKCPDCGGRLIERTGRLGRFFGCENYPKCRYTRSIR